MGHVCRSHVQHLPWRRVRELPCCPCAIAGFEVWTKGDIFQRFGTTWNNLHYGLTQQPKAQADSHYREEKL